MVTKPYTLNPKPCTHAHAHADDTHTHTHTYTHTHTTRTEERAREPVCVGMVLIGEDKDVAAACLHHGLEALVDAQVAVLHLLQDRLQHNHVPQRPVCARARDAVREIRPCSQTRMRHAAARACRAGGARRGRAEPVVATSRKSIWWRATLVSMTMHPPSPHLPRQCLAPSLALARMQVRRPRSLADRQHSHAQARTSTHKHAQARTSTHKHAQAHTRVHTHTHTHTYTHTRGAGEDPPAVGFARNVVAHVVLLDHLFDLALAGLFEERLHLLVQRRHRACAVLPSARPPRPAPALPLSSLPHRPHARCGFWHDPVTDREKKSVEKTEGWPSSREGARSKPHSKK